MMAVEVPTGSPSPRSRAPTSPQQVTLELQKTAKGRCGLTLSQSRKALRVEAVMTGSLASDAGFAVGDLLVDIDGVSVAEELRFSKIKTNGLLFDKRGTCAIVVLRGGGATTSFSSAPQPLDPRVSSALFSAGAKAALSGPPAAGLAGATSGMRPVGVPPLLIPRSAAESNRRAADSRAASEAANSKAVKEAVAAEVGDYTSVPQK